MAAEVDEEGWRILRRAMVVLGFGGWRRVACALGIFTGSGRWKGICGGR